MNKSYIPSLDGVRAVAVTLVFLFHFGRLDFISLNFEVGWVGVQMFFVLSGFLITRILLEQKKTPLPLYLKRFYQRRVLRIFPLYFGYVLLLSLTYFLFRQPDDLEKHAASLFTYTYNFSIFFPGWGVDRLFVHLWSLSVEEQFYILWPFVVYFLRDRQLKSLVIFLIFFCPVLRWLSALVLSGYWQDSEMIGNGVYWLTFNNLDAFAIGAGLNLMKSPASPSKSMGYIAITGIVCLTAGLVNDYLRHGAITSSLGYAVHGIQNLQHIWSYSLLNLFFAALLLHLIHFPSRILSGKIATSTGEISYGIYVFHFPVLVACEKLFGLIVNEMVTLGLCYVVTFVIAWCSYILYESRFLKYKAQLT